MVNAFHGSLGGTYHIKETGVVTGPGSTKCWGLMLAPHKSPRVVMCSASREDYMIERMLYYAMVTIRRECAFVSSLHESGTGCRKHPKIGGRMLPIQDRYQSSVNAVLSEYIQNELL